MAVLEVHNLNVRFGEHHAVRDVSLSVDAGEIVGLIGPNGAGKTTTFNAISGVQRCTGTVHLDGVDISSAPPQRRARLGMNRTFQRLEVFGSMTAYDNIRTAAEIAARARRQSMRRRSPSPTRSSSVLGLARRRRASAPTRCPPGRPASSSSVGPSPPTRRCCCSTSRRPASTTSRRGASPRCSRTLRDQGLAILLVEHDIDLVMSLCSRIYVLNLGELIAAGHPGRDPRRSPRAGGLPRRRGLRHRRPAATALTRVSG